MGKSRRQRLTVPISTPSQMERFTHSITSFALSYILDLVAAVAEIHRTLRPDGTAALTTWKVNGVVDLVHRVQQSLRPGGRLELRVGVPGRANGWGASRRRRFG